MQAANRVVKNTGILYIKMAITVFISLYTVRLVLSALGVKDFGLFNVVGGAIAMLGFLNGAMTEATQRYMSHSQGAGDIQRMNKIFNMSILLHGLIAILILILFEIAGYFFFHGILNIEPSRIETAKLIYQFMIISTIYTVISVPYNAILNAHENMLFYSLLGILEAVFKLSIAFTITYISGDKLKYYGALMALSSILLLIVNRLYCRRKYPETRIAIRTHYDKKLLHEMSSFAGFNFLGSASSLLAGYGSGIILNSFFGTSVNASNGIAVQINGQLLAFSNTMQKALNPVIVKSEGGGNRNLMVKAALSGCKFSFLLFAFFCIPMLIETPYILNLWLKIVPDWAIVFCRLTLAFTLIEQVTITLGIAISAVGNIKKINIYSSIINLIFIVALIMAFHLGAAPYYLSLLAILLASSMVTLKLFYAKKYCGINYSLFFRSVFLKILVVFVIAISLATMPLLFMNQSVIRLLLVCTLSSIAFFISSYIFAFSLEEKNIFKDLAGVVLSKIKKKEQL
jgi:O-antigen/teichoic acid export membrane protein